MEYRRGRITQEYRRRGRLAKLARFRAPRVANPFALFLLTLRKWFGFSGCPTLPVFGRVGVLTSLPLHEQRTNPPLRPRPSPFHLLQLLSALAAVWYSPLQALRVRSRVSELHPVICLRSGGFGVGGV